MALSVPDGFTLAEFLKLSASIEEVLNPPLLLLLEDVEREAYLQRSQALFRQAIRIQRCFQAFRPLFVTDANVASIAKFKFFRDRSAAAEATAHEAAAAVLVSAIVICCKEWEQGEPLVIGEGRLEYDYQTAMRLIARLRRERAVAENRWKSEREEPHRFSLESDREGTLPASPAPGSTGAPKEPSDRVEIHIDQDVQRVFELLAGSEDQEIARIVRSEEYSANEKMNLILQIDRRYANWNSQQWANLLVVSDAAIRRCPTWKNRLRFA